MLGFQVRELLLDRSDFLLPLCVHGQGRESGPFGRLDRIPRDAKTYQSVSTPGLYPAGEGAGYAGGITSAACDGIRIAEAISSEIG